jgi:hypothetical protein
MEEHIQVEAVRHQLGSGVSGARAKTSSYDQPLLDTTSLPTALVHHWQEPFRLQTVRTFDEQVRGSRVTTDGPLNAR